MQIIRAKCGDDADALLIFFVAMQMFCMRRGGDVDAQCTVVWGCECSAQDVVAMRNPCAKFGGDADALRHVWWRRECCAQDVVGMHLSRARFSGKADALRVV